MGCRRHELNTHQSMASSTVSFPMRTACWASSTSNPIPTIDMMKSSTLCNINTCQVINVQTVSRYSMDRRTTWPEHSHISCSLSLILYRPTGLYENKTRSDQIVSMRLATDRTVCSSLRLTSYSVQPALHHDAAPPGYYSTPYSFYTSGSYS